MRGACNGAQLLIISERDVGRNVADYLAPKFVTDFDDWQRNSR